MWRVTCALSAHPWLLSGVARGVIVTWLAIIMNLWTLYMFWTFSTVRHCLLTTQITLVQWNSGTTTSLDIQCVSKDAWNAACFHGPQMKTVLPLCWGSHASWCMCDKLCLCRRSYKAREPSTWRHPSFLSSDNRKSAVICHSNKPISYVYIAVIL